MTKEGSPFVTGRGGDRRAFFRDTLGRLAQEVTQRAERRVAPKVFFRPPGALDELAFLTACTRCEDCMKACPADAIIKAPTGAGFSVGTPIIDPAAQPCIVCPDMPCAQVCPTGALQAPPHLWRGYRLGRLELLPERCIAFDKVECGVCARACPIGEQALRLDDQGCPVIHVEGCVGCGVCVKACVTSPPSLELHLT